MPQHIAWEFISHLKPFDQDFYSQIPFHLKVLITLNFFATGSYQNSVGRSKILNVSLPSVSRILWYISNIIIRKLGETYIQFPRSSLEISNINNGFQPKFSIENIIRCIDCTHISIICPPNNDVIRVPPRVYKNRKRFYSINVEAVCDDNLRFLWVNAKFPGFPHDSGIWAVSPLRSHVKAKSNGSWLLEDSGYPLEPWLLTLYEHPTEVHQEVYNRVHIKTSCIERSFGGIKSYIQMPFKTPNVALHFRNSL